ncbi:MAG: hypothetical protein AUJ74_03140 [Candidatus Omnitrophica bacterium CG1_02_44_16]|nr:MAG: hypothetical protein AUJ74_03140 [Candidatus Omnitrophica bacterium CG1_02_44_16]PIY83213.1 MAG: hypothetical protein COY78_02810 [Candidatus Omnitrophica bacterium CG_4_10_14_0_8_um_filter_44_12]PIZ83176.1 MAG: hypothetical protein COX96_08780 [Candidatus Omnitrophica bacterium CG_4_10_14_0_2_um_filter_44_9]
MASLLVFSVFCSLPSDKIMPDPSLTPEEKLLRIIESPPQAVQSMRRERRGPDFKFDLKLLKAKYGEKLKAFLNLKAASVVLVFFSGLATMYLGLDFWLGAPRLTNVQRLEMRAKKMEVGDMTLGQLDPLSIYLHEITQRNIFSLPETVEQAAAKKAEPKVEIKSLIDGLKVVGIIWSDAPQAIVEDSKNGKTDLLNRGSKIRNARVKDILKDRVILSYDGQEVELM